MLEKEPILNPELKGAVWHERGATVDPFLVCQSFSKKAINNGVKLFH
jgi:glycine/D-amino acid oxidase-like deaminating enzyme